MRVQKYIYIEEIAFNIVQMKSLSMHIANHKYIFVYIYGREFTHTHTNGSSAVLCGSWGAV